LCGAGFAADKLMVINAYVGMSAKFKTNALEAIYRKTPERAETVSPKQKSLAKKRGASTVCFKYTSEQK